jgi:hypothetical protein
MSAEADDGRVELESDQIRAELLETKRDALMAMRTSGEIGEAAYYQIEEEAGPLRAQLDPGGALGAATGCCWEIEPVIARAMRLTSREGDGLVRARPGPQAQHRPALEPVLLGLEGQPGQRRLGRRPRPDRGHMGADAVLALGREVLEGDGVQDHAADAGREALTDSRASSQSAASARGDLRPGSSTARSSAAFSRASRSR